MNTKNIRRFLFIAGAFLVLLVVFGLLSKPGTPADNSVFGLQAPPFVGVARAETASIASIIEDEAGISAWFQASSSINLSSVRGVFRTIEVETADYIIGSVPVPNYDENWDVHVYIHKDGWVLAYYLAPEPAGKIFDWKAYHNSNRTNFATKLESALFVVADAAGVPFPGATYYDFRYPNATHLMLIGEWVYGYNVTDSFQVRLPGSFAYYERSWSLATTYYYSRYRLNGVEIKSLNGTWLMSQGVLSGAQLPPDQYHTIEIRHEDSSDYAYGGLALVYRVQ